jgi:nucleoside phosphorylase
MLAVCTSFGEEYSVIQSKMIQKIELKKREQRACAGLYQEIPIELILIGVGRANVEKFAKTEWTDYTGIILAGYCGGLVEGLDVGDLVLPTKTVNEYQDQIELEDLHLLLNTLRPVHRVPMVSVEKIVRTKAEKIQLAVETQALAVDMESYYLAKSAKEQGLPIVIVKAVADSLEDDLPDFGEVPNAATVKRGSTQSQRAAQSWKQNMLKARDPLSVACEQLIPAMYHVLHF